MGVALLLASNSPRRKELLTAAGFAFRIVEPQADESFDVDLTVRELTTLNATRKAMSIARKYLGRVILAADTLVALGNEIIGKPANRDDAFDMLRRLSGRKHEVCSAVFVLNPTSTIGQRTRWTSFHEISHVYFRRLSDCSIRQYLTKMDPLDKAGSYAAQGDEGQIIERIEGSYTNVVGLPMEKTMAALARFDIRPKN